VENKTGQNTKYIYFKDQVHVSTKHDYRQGSYKKENKIQRFAFFSCGYPDYNHVWSKHAAYL
jgi:hypothetical protein